MTIRLLTGDCREVLPMLADASVQWTTEGS
jgi:hypothetical protein